MGIWIELGIFGLALAFGVWQIHDVKKAMRQTRQRREAESKQAEASETPRPEPSNDTRGH